MTGMEMLAGGVACFAVGFGIGEGHDVHLGQTSTSVWLALVYLVVFGSLVAYTAYVWLLKAAPLSLVTTYAFVNPLVAILLGSVFLSEPFTTRTVLATLLITLGVVLMVSRRASSSRPRVPDDRVRESEGRTAPGPKGPEVGSRETADCA
jgi:drug/metabolite transporter (DMT)-like permease